MATPPRTLVQQLEAQRAAGVRLEQHTPTIDALASATLELGLSDVSAARRRQERNVNETQMISAELLEILACPICKTAVRLEGGELICDACGRHYQIDDGIPIMLVDEDD
jgi:uncharacterized protein YbaR (Trm112 family)